MPPKLDAYNLGELGVNRTKSPIHLRDGELLTAQNAALNPIGGNRAIVKRRGIAAYTPVASAGPVLSIYPIFYPDPGDPPGPATGWVFSALHMFYACPSDEDSNDHAYSGNGADWVDANRANTVNDYGAARVGGHMLPRWLSSGVEYLVLPMMSGGVLSAWTFKAGHDALALNGITAGAHDGLLAWFGDLERNMLWVAANDTSLSVHDVRKCNLATGVITPHWGGTFGTSGALTEQIWDIVTFGGYLYIATTEVDAFGDNITRIRRVSATVNGSTTVVHTFTDKTEFPMFCEGPDSLLLGNQTQAGWDDAHMLKTTDGTTWTTVYTAAVAADARRVTPLYINGNDMLAVDDTTLGNWLLLHSTDGGATWPTVHTEAFWPSAQPTKIGKLGGNYYWAESFSGAWPPTRRVRKYEPGVGVTVVHNLEFPATSPGGPWFGGFS